MFKLNSSGQRNEFRKMFDHVRKARKRGEYYILHREDNVEDFNLQRLERQLDAVIDGPANIPVLAERFAEHAAREHFCLETQVLDDKTYALRRTMRAAAAAVTIPAFVARVVLPVVAAFGGLMATHPDSSGACLVLPIPFASAWCGLALGLPLNIATALNFGSAMHGLQKTRKYYSVPEVVRPDFDGVNRANKLHSNDILNNDLKTRFVCERDNIWFRSLAIERSGQSTRRKHLSAVMQGLRIGFRHNAITSLFRGNDKQDQITFRLNDANYRNEGRPSYLPQEPASRTPTLAAWKKPDFVG